VGMQTTPWGVAGATIDLASSRGGPTGEQRRTLACATFVLRAARDCRAEDVPNYGLPLNGTRNASRAENDAGSDPRGPSSAPIDQFCDLYHQFSRTTTLTAGQPVDFAQVVIRSAPIVSSIIGRSRRGS
jgi:hypothetical protein